MQRGRQIPVQQRMHRPQAAAPRAVPSRQPVERANRINPDARGIQEV